MKACEWTLPSASGGLTLVRCCSHSAEMCLRRCWCRVQIDCSWEAHLSHLYLWKPFPGSSHCTTLADLTETWMFSENESRCVLGVTFKDSLGCMFFRVLCFLQIIKCVCVCHSDVWEQPVFLLLTEHRHEEIIVWFCPGMWPWGHKWGLSHNTNCVTKSQKKVTITNKCRDVYTETFGAT